MNLNFNYDGKTLLKKWWEIVRDNFTAIEDGHNTLSAALSEETEERVQGDAGLQTQMNTHIASRAGENNFGHVRLLDSVNSNLGKDDVAAATPKAVKAAYDKAEEGILASETVQQNLDNEISARQDADNELEGKIADEKSQRQSADDALSSRIAAVETRAHTHENKSVIDTITEERVSAWDRNTDLDTYREYVNEMFCQTAEELHRLYTLIGFLHYDGGVFGAEQNETALDGGLFEDMELGLFDCGGFEPITVSTGTTAAVIDGGNY